MNGEYKTITHDILNNEYYQKLKNEVHHHNSNRYNHCVEVSMKTYKICKRLNLDYISATRAALLHDFFFNSEFSNKKEQMLNHPKKAAENAKKITKLNKKELNVIESHMYPVGKTLPKHKESIIVDLVDDYIAIKEKIGGDLEYCKTALTFLLIIGIEFIIK